MIIGGINPIPHGTKVNFVGVRFVNYGISLFMIAVSLVTFFLKDLNYGIDFKGGIGLEVRMPEKIDLAPLRTQLISLDVGDVSLQEFGGDRDLLIRIERQEGDENAQQVAIEKVRDLLGSEVDFRRIETVGPTVGEEMVSKGLQAVFWALICMLIYIWFRFEWQFGLCAIIALLHDALVLLGLYAVFRLEFNTTAIVAVLITIGYSINDTVVIYDRIRENLRKYKSMQVREIINRSINETLSRTILTSASTLLALLSLYLFGGEVISSYSLPILVGVAVGTYSSIFVAAPLLLTFNLQIRQERENIDEAAIATKRLAKKESQNTVKP